MKRITLLLMLFAIVAYGSCNKDDDSPPLGKTKSDLLTSKTWKQTARTINPPIDIDRAMITDLYALDDACDKDDLYIFKSDNTFIQDEGLTKCGSSDPQVFASGTWALSKDETQLILTYTGIGSFTNNILEVTETTAKLSEVDTINGIVYTTTATYSAQ